jgi:hypothetical protein
MELEMVLVIAAETSLTQIAL